MARILKCPSCGRIVKVEDGPGEGQGQCPLCQAAVAIAPAAPRPRPVLPITLTPTPSPSAISPPAPLTDRLPPPLASVKEEGWLKGLRTHEGPSAEAGGWARVQKALGFHLFSLGLHAVATLLIYLGLMQLGPAIHSARRLDGLGTALVMFGLGVMLLNWV